MRTTWFVFVHIIYVIIYVVSFYVRMYMFVSYIYLYVCVYAMYMYVGKTTMGKMFAEFLVRCGLASGITIVTPAQFMSESSSETRDNLKGVLKAAALSGRVLFIDEAHTMFEVDGRNNGGGVPPLRDGSKTAFETIVSAIPGDGSSSFILILGGYTKELRDMLAHPNIDQGFARRVPNWVPFDDFDNEELRLLLKSTASDPRFNLHVDFPTVDMVVKHKLVGLRAKKGWGNAGSIVNIITDAAKEQQNRILESERRGDLYSPDDSTEKKKWKSSQLLLIDFGINMEMVTASNKEKVAQALKGLSNTAYFEGKFEEISESPSLTNPMKKPNFVFVGPPGTGR